MLKRDSEKGDKAYFRKSTEKLEIGDAEEKKNLWHKIKFLFLFPKKKK